MSTSEPYLIPLQPVIFEEEIKKSHFITYLAHTASIEAAKQFIGEVKSAHSNANHHCWGFVAGRPTDSMSWGFSDDGEPSGTAGKPILAQLTGCGVGELTAVVVRYFGGIHLGTGGLVKAYGGGVQQALTLLTTQQKIIISELFLCCDYNQISLVEALLGEYNGTQLKADYGQQVSMHLALDSRIVTEFSTKLINRSGGRIIATSTPDS
ncbi:elongation factor [Photobacterium kishitanii]|uniref:YigZ family protein n=1 Tax=Photobacterium kishitanii TaxID=318456 RepID=A0AAX0YSV0_9GAMM|nr:YigZ family protein [Photobacterium kishitanii]KJG08823.1 elongation factor [Photobacterium kishitanii]KJG56168.1 elongation factor [Photobacterium kishitanii]KJG59531.1 elongation factor [Photobacterium kishitanii]KJG64297.1 elongation factor [Photobacterium kishitanii]KJG68401.1 elongation factor [Photobacterium kishitanii]